MNIDIGPNAMATILGSGVLLIILVLGHATLTIKRTSRQEALRYAWEAWREVSMRAMEKGQSIPHTPEHGKH